MKHRKCGGKFVSIELENKRTVYQCNKCFKVITVYKRVATSGSPTTGKGK